MKDCEKGATKEEAEIFLNGGVLRNLLKVKICVNQFHVSALQNNIIK
jgi:hypothetical protein